MLTQHPVLRVCWWRDGRPWWKRTSGMQRPTLKGTEGTEGSGERGRSGDRKWGWK